MSIVFAAILAVALAQLGLSQSFTSSITGVLTDPSGGSVPGARIELKNVATNDIREATSQADGTYQFNNLNPGTYQITVTSAGFKTFLQDSLVLQAQTASTVNVKLDVGATSEKVEVSASATLTDTETANTAAVLDTRLIQELPNSTRNPLNFVFSLAGTTVAPGGQTQRNGSLDQMSSNFGLNGGRTGEESVLIDGAPSQALDWGGLLVAPLQDSVQEEQVITNTYDAQYERAGAGIVTLVTRGGSNRFHGEVYDYLQNSSLNANTWAGNRYRSPRGPFKQNQFGGNVGGPILKRYHLFFFAGYEGLRQPNTQASGLLTVPTEAERNGDFSHTLNLNGGPTVIYNPFTTTPVTDASGNPGFTRQAFLGNKIPSQLINPVGQKIANLFPNPNLPGDVNNYYTQGPGNTTNDKMDVRVDWLHNTIHRMFVRFSDRFRQDILSPCFFCNGADSTVNQNNNGWQAVLNDTITPSPTLVINAFVSYGRWREAHTNTGLGVATSDAIGLPPSLFQAPLLPVISADNYAQLSNNGCCAFVRYARTSSAAQINITKELSRHTLKFGGNYDVQMINLIQEQPGAFSFSNSLTSCDPQASGACLAQNTTSNVTGNAIASILLGTATGGGQSISMDPAMSIHIFGAYLQDQWRVTNRLTVNVGVRYENQRPATERYNRLMYFNPTAVNPISAQVAPLLGRPVNGEFEYASGNNRFAWPSDNSNFAPRIGIAYKITNHLVARAGAGIFYLPASAMIGFDDGGQSYGFSSSTDFLATTNNGYTPLNLVSNPFPNGLNKPTGSSLGGLTLVGDGMSQIWLKGPHPTPYSEQWSFGLQYQIGAHSVIEAGYSGVIGRRLLYGNPNLDADQLSPSFLNLGPKLDNLVNNPFFGIAPSYSYLGSNRQIAYNELLRPYPQYTYLVWTRSLPGASSSFNALNLKYNHTFSAGLSLLATYQWSKAMDNGPEDYFGWATGNQWRDAYHTNLDYNISTHDVPQSFATALVYELPYGKGKHWGNAAPAVVKQVLGNWQVSSSIRMASGLPLYQVFQSYDNHLNNYGFPGPQLANWGGKPSTTGNPNAWINPSTFLQPTSDFVLGNGAQRYTQLRERAERNVDLAVAKNFLIRERFKVQFRGEAFNLMNYAQYNLSPFNSFPLCVSCGDFGDLDSTENSPRFLQFSLKVVF